MAVKRAAAAAALLACILLAAAGAHAQEGQECDSSKTPGKVASVKALVIDDSTVDLLWLPPQDNACVTSFTVNAKDLGTGSTISSNKVEDGLRYTYTGLTPGAKYEFEVKPSGNAGTGPGYSTKAAMPPSSLSDAAPEAPENLVAVATGSADVQLTWGLPPGNPKVDSYTVKTVSVNATGFPFKGAKESTFDVTGDSRSASVSGLQPGRYYVFVVTAKNSKGSSPEPAVVFQRTPSDGEGVPGEPSDVSAAPAGAAGAVALNWQPPSGSAPDFYNVGITEVDGSGNAVSDTNTVPFKNNTGIVKDLNPGSTYRFDVQAFSTAYADGGSTSFTYTVPSDYSSAGIGTPGDLQAAVYGNQVQLKWEPTSGASYYVVSVYDAYSGRNLGVQYRTSETSLAIDGLPMGIAIQVVVQGASDSGFGEAAVANIEIPAQDSGYYGQNYSPYYGYNSYLPYWYSSYYPIGYYSHWYPGKWALNGLFNCVRPFNWYWGPGWWYNRPWGYNPFLPLNPWNAYRPYWWNGRWGNAWGWGYGTLRSKGLRPSVFPTLPNRLPGQLGRPSVRPTPLPGVIRPGAGGFTRPAPLPGVTRPGGGGGLFDGSGRPTTRPALPQTRPTMPQMPTTRPAMPDMPTTRPAMPQMPTTRPAMPQMPTTRPAMPDMPMTRPAYGGGQPMTRPAYGGGQPMTRPAFGGGGQPMTRPAFGGGGQMPMARPATGGLGGGGGFRGGNGGLGGGGLDRRGRRLL